ncbi:sugar transferase [Lacticaseibacillus chiayiensis]|uniref:sugar transferase n=1 Tax=Lacticaseibacillus chiayiensis TaxID=2100821 RepID=UPI0010131E27|nr:sugar transferase [Lacticaseibacillus chiayiensis]RXT58691.1 multidrug MFS transporter [Lacticaseibacillus chiayiensis]
MEKRIQSTNEPREIPTDRVPASLIYLAEKRVFDIFCGLMGMVLVVVAMLALFPFCLFGKNKGPLFFKQVRIGQNGKEFKIYKFRSMAVDAESKLRENKKLYQKYVANNYKLPAGEDPRVTKLGSFIRKTSLDELPQFINILKGDMSMIGPRPVVKEELVEYGNLVSQLLSAKPGAMGLWQASGRSGIPYPERAELELYYVRHRSMHYDLLILCKNIVSILKKDGAF